MSFFTVALSSCDVFINLLGIKKNPPPPEYHDLYFSRIDGGYEVRKGDTNVSSIVIPAEYNGEKVIKIGSFAFSNSVGLTEIVIPEGVTTIGLCAFSDCADLTEIVIPDGVTVIEADAFYNCSALADIAVPNGAERVGREAFFGTAWLDGLPDGFIYAGKVFYKYKGNMPDGTVVDDIRPDTVFITDSAFSGLKGLTEIIIPDGVKSIEDWTFADCVSLKRIEIPDGVTVIGMDAFNNCPVLTNVRLPDGLTAIGGSAFQYCGGLTEIVIPDGVTVIDNWTFADCGSLTSVEIGSGATSIGANAFYGCASLKSVEIGSGATDIGEHAFDNCSALKNITVAANNGAYSSLNGVLYNKARTEIIHYPAGKTETTFEIPNGVTITNQFTFNIQCGIIYAWDTRLILR